MLRKFLIASSLSIVIYYMSLNLLNNILEKRIIFIKALKKLKEDRPLNNLNKSKVNVELGYNEGKSLEVKVSNDLDMADIKLRYKEFILILISSSLLSFSIISWVSNIYIGLVGGLITSLLPFKLINFKKKSLMEKFNNQLGDALLILSNSLKAGFSFEQALASISRDLPDPIGREFRSIIREVELGEDLEYAMNKVAKKMLSRDMELINTAVAIQRQVGGNLSEILDSIGEAIRERFIMRKKIKAMSAQGEISGKIIAFLPIILLLIISTINYDYIAPMFNSMYGYVLLSISALLEIVGYLLIKRLINLEM